MTYIIKKYGVLLLSVLLLQSCIVNPDEDSCEIVKMKVTKIYEGGVKDIVIDNAENNQYYINRGLESGFEIETLQDELLHKEVTLHLAKTILGKSRHIAQLAVSDSIYYTEFN